MFTTWSKNVVEMALDKFEPPTRSFISFLVHVLQCFKVGCSLAIHGYTGR